MFVAPTREPGKTDNIKGSHSKKKKKNLVNCFMVETIKAKELEYIY